MGIFTFMLNIECSNGCTNTRHWDISRKKKKNKEKGERPTGRRGGRAVMKGWGGAGEGQAPVRETGGAKMR